MHDKGFEDVFAAQAPAPLLSSTSVKLMNRPQTQVNPISLVQDRKDSLSSVNSGYPTVNMFSNFDSHLG